MSVINYVTGYHGFTTEPGYGDNNGYVKKCIVAVEFPYQGNDVDFFISTGANDWGAKMGDGSIIPLSSPVIIAVGKNNAFVQFDMETGYPSNSPLFLVYRSDTAGMSTTARDTDRSFTANANSATGKFAFTTEPGSGPNGYTTKCIATFSFPMQPDEPAFDITTDPSHWGLRVGNGTVINLSSPKVLSINREAAVVEFTMATSYPTNSPGILIIRSSAARYTVVPTAIHEYVAVTNITSPGESIVLGNILDLSSCGVEPYNATYKEITWTVVSGSGNIIDNTYVQGTAVGTLKIRGTVKNKSNNTTDFSKDFNITITTNTIRIQKQPDSAVTIESGKTGTIDITAFADSSVIEYQWYINTKNSISGATALTGETSDELIISSNIGGGVHYFFCKVSAPYTTDVYSIISKVTINVLPSSMAITPSNPSMLQAKEVQLSIDWIPSDITDTAVLWKSSNTNVAVVNSVTGLVRSSAIGTATITATRIDGKMSATTNVTVQAYKAVTNITDVPTSVYVGDTLTLTGTIIPSDAAAKTITWSIVKNDADATLNGNRLVCNNSGSVIVRATMEGGKNENERYIKDFTINCEVRFIAVSNISISASLNSNRFVGDKIEIDPTITPSNATEQEIEWSIVSGNCIIAPDEITLLQGGDLTIRATIINGKGTQDNRSDYTKDFTFTNISEDEFTAVQIAYIVNNNIDPFDQNSIYTGTCTDGLNVAVIPENASYTAYTCRLVSFMVGTLSEYHGDIESINDWKTAPTGIFTFNASTNTFSIVRDKLGTLVKYRAEFTITIKNGISSSGDDFVTTDYLYIDGFPMEPYVPLKDLTIELPSVLRCMTPILLTKYTLNPEFPTIYDKNSGCIPDDSIDFIVESTGTPEESAICQIYYYQGIDGGSSGEVTHTVVPPDIFKFDLNELYLYPWNVGSFRVTVTVKKSTVSNLNNFDKYNPKLVDFKKVYDLKTLPPFIPVKLIKGIPNTIYLNKPFILTPEVSTEGGLNCYNPYWDEEVATYQNIVWTIVNSSGGVTIKDGVIIATKENVSFTLRASIASGIREAQKWYDWEDEKIDYTESFEINVVAEDEDMTSVFPFLNIKLKNGNTVKVSNVNDMIWVCNDKPSSFSITIGNNSFKKSDIVELAFYDITKDIQEPAQPIAPTKPTEPDPSDFDLENMIGTDIEDWRYELNDEDKTIELKQYIGSSTDVMVYPTYKVGNYLYNTIIIDASYMFHNKSDIENITFSEYIDTSKCTNMTAMFNMCTSLVSIDFGGFDTSNVTDMSRLFDHCKNLESVDLSNFNTEKVTDMSKLFYHCDSIASLILTNFDTSNVTDMSYMFCSCYALTVLNVNEFDTSKCTNMTAMFNGCKSITNFSLSMFDTSNVTNMRYMFKECTNATKIYLTSWRTSNVTDMGYMFNYCSSLEVIWVTKGLWTINSKAITESMFEHAGVSEVTYSTTSLIGGDAGDTGTSTI